MKKSIGIFCLTALLLAIATFALVLSLGKGESSLSLPREEAETALPAPAAPAVKPQKTESENFPFDSLSNYGISFFLHGRDFGQTGMMKGKVAFVFVLVSDSETVWSEEAVAELKATHEESVRIIMEEKAPYDVELEILLHYIPCTITGSMSREENQYVQGLAEAVTVMGYANREEIIPSVKTQLSADEAALLFCVNSKERSFCFPATETREFECGVLYGSDEDFRHETYHLFGARDLYEPSRAEEWARICFPDSIMLTTKEGARLDSFSAYKVGWTETVSPAAKIFLKAMRALSAREWNEE